MCYFVASGVNAATPTLDESRGKQVSVLELYTAYGCSRCPPADAWLRKLADWPGLWREFIPLAFPVDYWNDLGGPDRVASKTFSDRQREYARQGRLSSVYTPGFVLRGHEWRGWFRRSAPEWASRAVVGKLSLELRDDSHALIRFTPQEPVERARFTVHLAILGFGLTTAVAGGENRGRKLEEDFVVLGYRSAKQSSSLAEWNLALPKVIPARTTRRAIAAWVSVDADPTPRQAVGGWLPSET
jgi:hypothetical protein